MLRVIPGQAQADFYGLDTPSIYGSNGHGEPCCAAGSAWIRSVSPVLLRTVADIPNFRISDKQFLPYKPQLACMGLHVPGKGLIRPVLQLNT